MGMGYNTRISMAGPRANCFSTYPWRAPELWRVQTPQQLRRAVTPAIDIWSYGVMCADTINAGGRLFGGSGEADTGSRIQRWSESAKGLEVLVQTMPSQWQGTIRASLQPKPHLCSLTLGQQVASQAGLIACAIASQADLTASARQAGLTTDGAAMQG